MSTCVLAANDIPEGICSLPGVGPIDLRSLFRKSTSDVQLHVDVCGGNLTLIEKQFGENWARFIAVAKDCHEQNAELLKSGKELYVRTTRAIKANEELFVWIGVDMLSELEFPFLKPSNIKGNQAYYCHKCGQVFENPNPLKVHLSFLCQTSDITAIQFPVNKNWSTNQSYDRCNRLNFFGAAEPVVDTMKIPIVSSKRMPLLHKPKAISPVLNSHFLLKPASIHDIRTSNQDRFENMDCDVTFKLSPSSNVFSPSSSSIWKSSSDNCPTVPSGHVCTYCGKIYSRKYGLKIHVRTHTGYKPLKCKYCFRPFSDPSNLNKHVRLHSETDTPYRCSICGKVLVRRRDLERHIKSRHPQGNVTHSEKQHVKIRENGNS